MASIAIFSPSPSAAISLPRVSRTEVIAVDSRIFRLPAGGAASGKPAADVPASASRPEAGRPAAARPAADPRGAAWLLGERGEGGSAGAPSSGPAGKSEAGEEGDRARGRLAELDGEKARLASARASRASAKAAETSRVLVSLRSRDAAVRAHEAAHIASGGLYVTHGASYSYQRGPDGRSYAVGGEVGIDTSIPLDPREALRKMQIVRAAALAPAEPSAADLAVAAAAAAAEAQILTELAASSWNSAGIADLPNRE